MHARKVLVFKDVNYGASKGSATQATALNPADLRDGAIGVYGIHTAGATNLNKLVLIADGGAEAAGIIAAASFVGKEIFIAVGKVIGCEVSQPIQLTVGLKSAAGAKYVAPVRGEIRIGYNGTTGSLNFPVVTRGADFTVGVINKADKVSGYRQPFQKVQLSIQAKADGESAYSILSRWIAMVNLRTDEVFVDKTLLRILHNGTGAVFTTAATVAAVNGATTLTTSAAHGVTAGDAISLGGDYYLTLAGTSGTTLVLDRPYQGPTATIANAATLDITGAATQFGLVLVDRKDLLNLSVALQGDLAENATKTQQVAPSIGSGGVNALVVEMEKEALGKKGSEDQITSYVKRDIIYSQVAGSNYDLYFLEVQNSNQAGGDQGAVFNLKSYITCAFVAGVADTTNFNQSDFEDVMTSLFGATFPAISA
jgi:hypothetical protein